jgi:hypothetical protein
MGFALVALYCVGCNKGAATYPAGGTVTLTDGTPLAGGSVTFRSLDVEGNPSAKGEIQPDGSFKLTTLEPGDGAVLGKHQVIVNPPVVNPPREGWPTPPAGPRIDARFSSYQDSGLEFTVTDDEAQNQFKIEVTPAQR